MFYFSISVDNFQLQVYSIVICMCQLVDVKFSEWWFQAISSRRILLVHNNIRFSWLFWIAYVIFVEEKNSGIIHVRVCSES